MHVSTNVKQPVRVHRYNDADSFVVVGWILRDLTSPNLQRSDQVVIRHRLAVRTQIGFYCVHGLQARERRRRDRDNLSQALVLRQPLLDDFFMALVAISSNFSGVNHN